MTKRQMLSLILIVVGLEIPSAAQDQAQDRAIAGILWNNPYEETIFDDTIQQPLEFGELEYPLGARQTATEGMVVIRGELDGDGTVLSAKVISGPRTLVTASYMNFMQWRFPSNPPSKVVVVIYQFRLEGYCVSTPCRSTFTIRPRNVAVITAGMQLINHGATW